MRKLTILIILVASVASPAFTQSLDPHLGSGNLSTLVEPGVTYVPGVSRACGVRRVQFSNAFGWEVRDVLVCCRRGRCTSQLTY